MLCWAERVERCYIELFHAAMCCVGLSELSGVVLSCFTISSSAVFTDVSLIRLQVSFSPCDGKSLFSVLGQKT